MKKEMQCPYCGAKAELTDSVKVYGKSFGNIILCTNYPKCDAFVGVHKATNEPLGTLANQELRELRKQCHALFDPLWQRTKDRHRAYSILRHSLNIPEDKCHIAMFDIETCLKCIALLKRAQGQPS